MSIRFISSDAEINTENKSETNKSVSDQSEDFIEDNLSKKKILRSILKSPATESDDRGVDNDTFTDDTYSEEPSEDDDSVADDSEHLSQSEINTQSIEIDCESETELSGDRKISELQNYVEILKSTGKIEKVAITDLNGKILIRSIGMGITEEEAFAALCILRSSDKTLAKIRIDKQDYTCFKNSSSSFVGRAENDFLHVRSCLDIILICISDPNSPGSSIYEVSRFVQRCYRTSNISTGFGNVDLV
jgi:hypothetical protein